MNAHAILQLACSVLADLVRFAVGGAHEEVPVLDVGFALGGGAELGMLRAGGDGLLPNHFARCPVIEEALFGSGEQHLGAVGIGEGSVEDVIDLAYPSRVEGSIDVFHGEESLHSGVFSFFVECQCGVINGKFDEFVAPEGGGITFGLQVPVV